MAEVVIVGAGSAGAVLASRLSEDPATTVTLLEAGPGRVPRESLIPAGFSRLFGTPVDWDFHTAPEPLLNGRSMYWPRGRMLGGSSAMNAMIWTRPARADLDRWSANGADGWSYAEVEEFFAKAELPADSSPSPDRVGIPVSPLRSPSALVAPFLDGCRSMGLSSNAGFLDGVLDGASAFRVTQCRGQRVSTEAGYLTPVRSRPNLTVVTEALVDQVNLEGTRATGVRYLDRAGTQRIATGRVVLAAGALGSPAILLRSGIGPADELRRLGIAVAVDLPGVGENLQDHLACGRVYRLRRPLSLANSGGWLDLIRYLVRRRGPLTSNVAEAGAFFSLDGPGPAPALEVILGVNFFVDHGRGNPEGHGLTLAVILQHPDSRGRLSLTSTRPNAPPRIEARYLSEAADQRRLLDGLAWLGQLAATGPLAAEIAEEAIAGVDADPEGHLRRLAQTLYHPVGTCAMGHGPNAVVGPDLLVRGIDDLWVADASVMPDLPTGHPHAPCVALAERAATLIGGA